MNYNFINLQICLQILRCGLVHVVVVHNQQNQPVMLSDTLSIDSCSNGMCTKKSFHSEKISRILKFFLLISELPVISCQSVCHSHYVMFLVCVAVSLTQLMKGGYVFTFVCLSVH